MGPPSFWSMQELGFWLTHSLCTSKSNSVHFHKPPHSTQGILLDLAKELQASTTGNQPHSIYRTSLSLLRSYPTKGLICCVHVCGLESTLTSTRVEPGLQIIHREQRFCWMDKHNYIATEQESPSASTENCIKHCVNLHHFMTLGLLYTSVWSGVSQPSEGAYLSDSGELWQCSGSSWSSRALEPISCSRLPPESSSQSCSAEWSGSAVGYSPSSSVH